MEKSQLRPVNIAKAIGIIAVVLGHSFQESSSSPIRAFVYMWHVPLFFFLSGYLYQEEYAKLFSHQLKKKFTALYYPFVAYGIPFVLLHNFFFSINIYSSLLGFRNQVQHAYGLVEGGKKILGVIAFRHIEQLLGGFWFLPCLFVTWAAFHLINRVSQYVGPRFSEEVRASLVTLLFLSGYCIVHFRIYDPFAFSLSFSALTLFYGGFLLRKNDAAVVTKRPYFLLFLLVLIFCAEEMMPLGRKNGMWDGLGDIVRNLSYLFKAGLWSYAIYCLSVLLDKTVAANALDYIGRRTIVILAFHFLCFKMITLLQIMVFDKPLYFLASFPVLEHRGWWALYFFMGITGPLCLRYVLDRLSLIRTYNSLTKTKMGK